MEAIRYLEPKINTTAESMGIQVDIIDPVSYDMMNDGKVLVPAQALYKNQKS